MDQTGYSSGKYGGSIRESGGAFGAREFANEELYFRKQDELKFKELKEKLDSKKVQSPNKSTEENKK